MKSAFGVFVLGFVLTIGACAISGCGSKSAKNDKMTTDKMGGGMMDDGKMHSDKMDGGKMGEDKMSGGKMASDKMDGGKMSDDKMK